jgi:hypothetical protein
MRVALALISILLPLSLSLACPPNAGYIGAIYKQGSDLNSLMEFLKASGIASSMEVGPFNFSPYSNFSYPSIYISIGSYEEGGSIKAYVFPGSSYTLLMVETDTNLSEAPLIYAESLLSGYLNPELIVNVSSSPNNWVPPVPLAEWSKLEKGEELKISVYKCGFIYSKLRRPQIEKVGVIANDIDYSLSFDMIRDAFERRGVGVDYLGSGARALIAAQKYRAVIILGGPKAPIVGRGVIPIMGEERKELGERGWVIVTRPWGTGIAVVIAGADRYLTREAVKKFLSSELFDQVVRVVKEGREMKRVSEKKGLVELVSSFGRCGYQEGPSLSVTVRGSYAYANYSLGHANPCAKFVLRGYEMEGNRIEIELSTEETAEICVQCIGVIYANLVIGPLPPGSYELCIGGLCVPFRV